MPACKEPPVSFERPAGLPRLERLPNLAGAPVYSSLKELSGGAENSRAYGRDFLDIPLMASQMAYFMTSDYVADLLGKRIPQELFPGGQLRYGEIEASPGWTPSGWDVMALRHRLPIAGNPERGSRDLAPVNGPLPFQALIRGLYIAATAMTAQVSAPSSREPAPPIQ